mgnify:CR=1 FL=1
MSQVWAELRSIATEVTGLARAIATGTRPPFALQVSATGSDNRKAEGGGPYSTWTDVDLQLWQNETTLLVIAVSTCPRPLSQVVIDLTPLSEILLQPNATARVDVGRAAFGNSTAGGVDGGEYTVEMVDRLIHDKIGFNTGYAAHHYQIPLP